MTKLIVPQTTRQSLVLNQEELRRLDVGGVSYNLYDLLSHYQSIDHLSHHALLLPSPKHKFLDCTKGFNKLTEDEIVFRSSVDGRKLTVTFESIRQLEAIFDTVFYPEESLATVIGGSRLVYLPYGELTRFRNKYGNQYDHRLYVTDVRDMVEWSALSAQKVAWVVSDLAFIYASKSVALVSTRQLALDSDSYRMVYEPLAEDCSCYTCQQFTCAYLHHLLKQTPLLAIKLVAIHNLTDMIYHS